MLEYQFRFSSGGLLAALAALDFQLILGQCQQECVAVQLLLLLWRERYGRGGATVAGNRTIGAVLIDGRQSEVVVVAIVMISVVGHATIHVAGNGELLQ